MRNIKFFIRSYHITCRSKISQWIANKEKGAIKRQNLHWHQVGSYLFLTHFYTMHDPKAEFRHYDYIQGRLWYYKVDYDYIQC